MSNVMSFYDFDSQFKRIAKKKAITLKRSKEISLARLRIRNLKLHFLIKNKKLEKGK